MAKNMIQFQKGLSITEFMLRYATEDNCRRELFKLRWPDGFVCPDCGNNTYCELRTRKIFQCNRCHSQISITAGTIFHASHLPLSIWFLAIYLLTQNKTGISALALSRQLGVSYNAAWRLKHKLMQVMLERGSDKTIGGRIVIDDAYLGGKGKSGKRGRGAKGKTPFVAAVETHDGKPIHIKLSRVSGFRQYEIERWSKHHLRPRCKVVSDGLACFNAVAKAHCRHEPHVVGGVKEEIEHPRFKWVNTILGNVKNSLKGTYHSFSKKHVPRYLAEFQYRFNRRFDLPSLIPRLVFIAVRTPPMPERLLTLAEKEW